MIKNQLTVEETKDMFMSIAANMVQYKEMLTQADKEIGDGDHGVNMARGFQAVLEKLDETTFNSIGDLLETIGMTLLTSVGGAAGAIFGTWFLGGSKNLKEEIYFNSLTISQWLVDGLEAVKLRGKAKVGDKTMIDALEPAAIISKEVSSLDLPLALLQIASEAIEGAKKTKNMVATVGKAKTLGERSIGHGDPGALSTSLIFSLMLQLIVPEKDEL